MHLGLFGLAFKVMELAYFWIFPSGVILNTFHSFDTYRWIFGFLSCIFRATEHGKIKMITAHAYVTKALVSSYI